MNPRGRFAPDVSYAIAGTPADVRIDGKPAPFETSAHPCTSRCPMKM
jgi:hypothetical protein